MPQITAFLFHAGGDDDPATLAANGDRSFAGSFILGMGFTFDDTDTKGVASPISMMHGLIAKDPRNAERIFPYIGGEEVNDSPSHAHHRYVINFENLPLRRDDLGKSWAKADQRQREVWLRSGIVPLDYPEPVAADWPGLLAILEEKVRPVRATDNREVRRRYWWHFAERTPALYAAVAPLDRALAACRITQYPSFTFLPKRIIYDITLNVFALDTCSSLCVLQSRAHELWARFFGSSMKEDLRYTPSDCFETFPFPDGLRPTRGSKTPAGSITSSVPGSWSTTTRA